MSENNRIINLLSHYRHRLRNKGSEEHEDDLEYLLTILESPFVKEFFMGNMSSEDNEIFNQVTSEVISAFEDQESDSHLSPEAQRKKLLRRKASLRALKLAVTPQSSPLINPKGTRPQMATHGEPSLLHNVMTGLGSKESSRETTPSMTYMGTPPLEASRNIDHIYISPFTGRKESPSLLGNNPVVTKGDDLLLGGNGSHAYIHEQVATPSYSSSRKTSLASSQITDMFGSQSTILRADDEGLSHGGHMTPTQPALPSYNEALSLCRKARSFERLPITDQSSSFLPFLTHGDSPITHGDSPMTAGSPTKNIPTNQEREDDMTFTVQLNKGDKGLGFSIMRPRVPSKDNKIVIQDIQPGGVAEKDGRIKSGDQILSINGQSVIGISQPTVVSILQQARGLVQFVMLRCKDNNNNNDDQRAGRETAPISMPISHTYSSVPSSRPFSASPTIPPPPHPFTIIQQPSIAARITPPPMTPPTKQSSTSLQQQQQQQQVAVIELPNEGRGFGFSIISSSEGKTFVHLISSGSLAEKDGRLMKDDQLLSVNGESVLGISHGAILDKLQNISKSGDPLRLVVGRIVSNVSDDSFSDIDSSSDAEEVEVELTKPAGSKGLGISINALVNDDNGEDKGIYIRSVNPNGPAGMSGRVRRKDRILQVNHHSLKGLSNMEAAEVLRGAGSKVRLVLERKRGLGNDLPEIREDQILSMVDKKSSKNDNPIAQWQTEMTGQLEQKDIVRGDGPVAMETNDCKEEENIIQSWSSIVGNDKEIIVAYINKPADEKGLGFRMESIAVVDDSGQKQIGSIHHMIKHIREGGPMDSCECLNEGDEILEVNGETLMGMSHDRAIEIVRQTSDHVMVVVCRTKIPTDRSTIVKEASDTPDMPFIEVQQPTTSESEDDHCTSSTTMTSSSSPSLQAIYQTVPDFSRRFERLSWRERHMEETRRLKERFESRRVEYNRYFQEQEDELRRAEQETAERRIRLQEEEEKHKQDTDGKRSSLKSGLHYSYYSPVRFPSLHETGSGNESSATSPAHQRDSMASEDSTTSALSPIPGITWEMEVSEIDLIKGTDGLGFSIIDFADDTNPGERVIIVHSLVPGGTAERDGRLQKGDKLISVNGVPIIDHTLFTSVELLKAVNLNETVTLCVNHSLPLSPDFGSTSSSFSPDVNRLLQDTLSEEHESDKDDLRNETITPGLAALRLEDVTIKKEERESDMQEREAVDDDIMKCSDTNRRSSTPDGPLSPANPNLSFSRTRSDEPINNRSSIMPLKQHTSLDIVQNKLTESTSEETLVPSLSNQDLQLSSSQPSPKQQTSPLMKTKPIPSSSISTIQHTAITASTTAASTSPTNSHTSITTTDTSSTTTTIRPTIGTIGPTTGSTTGTIGPTTGTIGPAAGPTTGTIGPAAGTIGPAAGTIAGPVGPTMGPTAGHIYSPSRSQDSYIDNLSPDNSDNGEHSTEMEFESREVDIKKGTYPLGMAVMENKGYIVVKKIDGGSILAKDGRIRVGDRILAINGKSIEGLSLVKVRSILKRASSAKSTRVKITYLPAPQGFPLTYNASTTLANQTDTQLLSEVKTNESHQYGQHISHPLPLQHMPMMATPINHTHPNMPQYNYSSWVQRNQPMRYPHPQREPLSYVEQPTPIKPHPPPPPPYMYQANHMPPGNLMVPGGFHPQQSLPPWNMPEYGPSNTRPPIDWVSPGGTNIRPSQYDYMSNQYRIQQQQQQQQQQHALVNKYAPPTHAPPTHMDDHSNMHHMRQGLPRYPVEQYPYSPYSPQRYEGGGGEGSGYDQLKPRPHRNIYIDQDDGSGRIWSHDMPGSARNMYYMDPTQPHLVEVTRNATGSLGINLGQIEGGAGGVTINGISPACQSMTKGRLNPGDRILEVNGIDLRNASQADAIAIIMKAGNPVHLLVQSYAVSMPATPPTATANKRKIHSSPLHSNDGSWAIDEEEDEELRQLYPNANGHLYQVTLKKSPGGGLGLSICRINPSPGSGVCIMQIQPGGIADQTRKIKVGDELIQVNDHCIAGLSQQDVSDLLSQASLHVTLTLIRPFPDPIGPPQPSSVRPHASPHPSPQVIEQQKYQSAPVDMLSGLPLVKAITIERDDNLGLGFTVSKTETTSGTTGIIVTNITPNGPAEKEGQLQVGDSVISIDGHKVLGDKYEKATHLLQQARCNGSVSLIVTANKSQLPSQLKERLEKSPKKRNMGDKRMRVRSEGVTLRNKVTKTQLSTRRRPVSVDCDINYDNLKELTDVSKINSQLLQQKNQAAVPSPNKVNTMTQAEMMKDVDLYTTSTTEQDVIVGKPTDIEIFCGNQPLGVVLAKEMNSYQSNMFIHKIQGKSPAALDGRLKPNDVILSICDQPLENLSRDQAYQLLLDAPPLVKMSIYRRPSDKGRKEEGHEIEVVELIKPEKGGLGLMIQGDQVDGGVIITEVIPDEVADRSGRVHPGDKILNINGENVSKYNQDSVSSILQTCRGLVSLTLHHSNQKYNNMSNISTLPGSSLNRSTPSREFTYSPSKIEVHPPPPVYDTSSPTKRIPRPFDPPPYLSPVDSAIKQSPRGTTPLRTDPSYSDDSTSPHPLKPHSNQFRDVVGQNIPDPKRYPPAGTTAIIPPPDRSDMTYQSNIKHVILQRGPAGLGFSIAGGKGSPNGDLPICIRSISKDCVAARQGRIRQGDIILAVNGISFENITHKAAVDALTRSHGDITLTICST